MELKRSERNDWVLDAAAQIWRTRRYLLLGALLYTALIFTAGAYFYHAGIWHETIKPLLQENFNLVPKVVAGMLSQPKRFVIDIKHEHFQKLAYQREVALANGILIKGDEDYVPAAIRYGNEIVKVKMRLKGDWTDHLQGDKWSHRIKVKGENTILGMKQFSIQHPKTRNYIDEWIFHRALKREGVLGLRYEFVEVTLNGKDLGIYALEEHFEKRLIEHNRLREGPIVRFNEDLLWEEKLLQRLPFPDAEANGAGYYSSSDIDGFQTNGWLADSAGYLLGTRAIHLLEAFRRGVRRPSEVFDVPKLARYFAIVDLLGAQHAALWHNARFYYNPVTSRLEIIGFDADSGHPIQALCVISEGVSAGANAAPKFENYFATIASDRGFFEEYVKALERVSAPSYLDEFFAELEGELQQNLNILYREFPSYEFSKEVFYRNQAYIRTVLNPVKGLHAYYRGAGAEVVELELGNIQYMPLAVTGVSYKDAPLLHPNEEIILPAKRDSEPVDYRSVGFSLLKGFAWSDTLIPHLKVNYRVLGASPTKSAGIFPWRPFDDKMITGDFLRRPPNADKFNFLKIDQSSQRILAKPGNWNLSQNLIIPKGYQFICGPGTRLNLSSSAKILSYAPLEFRGTEENPILIHSADSTGQGVVVMSTHQQSTLEYVVFDNLSNPSEDGWTLTGAVNFYESPVLISHCRFQANRCEDGLNIIRSEFSIENAVFKGTSADAFDADFTKGKIVDTVFLNCGNDGIDVSGSEVEVRDVVVDGAGDKGLSAGENSRMTATGVVIRNAEIAVAGKDMSEVVIDGIDVSNSRIGFTPYQKKPEFDFASIKVANLKMSQVELPYLVEEGSILIVEGETIAPSRKKVEEILYGVEYGKASR
jgi:hypothetical protein